MQQERELAQLEQETEATKRLILEVRREAGEVATLAVAATARAANLKQQAEQAARQ
jgi:hypothetical protein